MPRLTKWIRFSTKKRFFGSNPTFSVLDLGIVLLATIYCGVWFSKIMLERLDFFDMSGFLDSGYRILQGQTIYRDFFFNAGPIHPYMHAIFFALFGFHKYAILAHLIVVQMTVFLALTYLCRKSLPTFVTLLVLIVSGVSFYGPIGHPWYDQSAWLWGTLAICCAGSQVLEVSEGEKIDYKSYFVTGALLAFSFLAKSNVGLGAGLAVFLSCIVYRRRAMLMLASIGSGFLLVAGLLILTLTSPLDYFYQNFVAYLPSGRLRNWDHLYHAFSVSKHTQLFFLSLLPILLGHVALFRKYSGLVMLTLGVFLGAFFAVWTGSMYVHTNLGGLGVHFALVLILSTKLFKLSYEMSLRRRVFIGASCLYIWGSAMPLYEAAKRAQLRTWDWKQSNTDNRYTIQTPAFKGWKCNPRYGEGLDKTIEHLNAHVPKDESLLVVPDATLIYGLTNRPSYVTAPFMYHIMVVPPRGRVLEHFVERLKKEPPQWIVVHEQWEIQHFTDHNELFKYLGIPNYLKENYREQWRYQDYALLKKVRDTIL